MALPQSSENREGRPMDDRELIARCRRGDARAFDELVHRYDSKVYNLAYRLLGDGEDAADVAQEAFLRIHRGLRSFHGSAALTTWIYRIVHNLCLDELKKRRRRPQVLGDPTPGDEGGDTLLERMPDEEAEPQSLALADERQRAVRAAIDRLRPHHREVIVLYDLEGFSYHEIAEILATNVGTIKSRLNRARLALARELESCRELFR